jgi:broad specificity phosphatase PhoE
VVVYFITHAEVDIDQAVRVEQWGLSIAGRDRVSRIAENPWVRQLGWVASSNERKAVDTAEIVAELAGVIPFEQGDLGELDRSSTGYLPAEEFEATVDRFFAEPLVNVRGWESAQDAQRRIVRAARRLSADSSGDGALVAHGGVGNLLLCDLLGVGISQVYAQPGLGSYFVFDPVSWSLVRGWERVI